MALPIITTENGSRQPMFIIVEAALLATSLSMCIHRLYCRIVLVKSVGLDDYLITAALSVAIALGIMNGYQVSYGTGLHGEFLPSDPNLALIPTLQHWYAYQIVYPLALLFTKLSFLALYWRVFTPPVLSRTWVLATACFGTIYTLIIMLVSVFECHGDISKAWAITFPEGCHDLKAYYFSTASINIATDIAILLLPIQPLTRLNVNRRKKAAIFGIFMLGGGAVIASGVRIWALWRYFYGTEITYDAVLILLWSQIEINTGIICASIPSLRPLFRRTFNNTTYSHGYHESGTSGILPQRRSVIELSSDPRRNAEIRAAVEAQLRAMDNDSDEMVISKRMRISQNYATSREPAHFRGV
ncbi:hypothetical protein Q7P37_006106 [Cladosporium fusiforme]